MKTRLLKISMLIVGLMFVFTAASWAESGKDRYRKNGAEKRIEAKHFDRGSSQRMVRNQGKQNFYHRNKWVPMPRKYHRNQFIRRHRQLQRKKWLHRHYRQYSDNSYDEGGSYNEFSVAASFSEPGVEFSIGSKRVR